MKTKAFGIVCALSLLLSGSVPPTYAQDGTYMTLYVSPNGTATGNGTASSPFCSIVDAKEYVATVSDEMTGDIVVNIQPGTYFVNEPIVFGSQDSGKNGHRVIYRGQEMPVISGGVRVGDFQPTAYNNIYRANVDGISMLRELYVNGKKSYVASSSHTVMANGYYQDEDTLYDYDGMYVSRADFDEYANASDIELSWLVNWKYTTALVDKIIPDPDNPDQLILLMQQDWWERAAKASDSNYGPKPYRQFTVKNAFELLDEPGEFYYNKYERAVYYMPRADEDLSTAEVIAPSLDKIIKFDGNDDADRVQNVTIEGLKLAHLSFYGPEDIGVDGAQAQFYTRTNGIPWYIPSGISVARASGIEFKGNYFFGFGACGIELTDAVSDTSICGNAFSDLGDAAVVVGRHYEGACGKEYTDTRVVPPADADKCNLIDGKVKTFTSYRSGDSFVNISGNRNWYDPATESIGSTWSSDPNAPARGEASYIMYDFERAYTLSDVILAFDKEIPEEARAQYQILASNTRTFAPGTYDILATQDTPAVGTVSYPIDTIGKRYRFLMVRTIGATPLSVSKLWALTTDRKPYTTAVMTYNNTISNNYIERVGETIYSGGGINIFYTRGLTLTHNEISNTPYSGIMMGWGWRNEDNSSSDNTIAYNYVHDTNLLLDDGGGIYTLSRQDNTSVRGNYIKSVAQGRAAIYTDEGSSKMTISDNVIEDCVDNYFIWLFTIRDNQYTNGYGWAPQHSNNGTNNQVDDINIYLPGIDPPAVAETKANAGVEDGYKYLKDLVPVSRPHVIDSRSGYDYLENTELDYIERYIDEVITNMLTNGKFGGGVGEYPSRYYYQLSNALQTAKNPGTGDRAQALMSARALILEAANSVNTTANSDPTQPLQFLYVDGMLSEQIDYSSQTIYLTMNDSVDLTKCAFTAECGTGYESAVFEPTINLSNEFAFPVYNTIEDTYSYWDVVLTTNSNNAYTTSEYNRSLINKACDGSTLLSPYALAYMHTLRFGTDQTQYVKFTPYGNSKNAFSLIFGAGFTNGFDATAAQATANHLRLDLVEDTATLVYHIDGADTIIKQDISVPISFNSSNFIGIKQIPFGSNSIYAIIVNGTIADAFIYTTTTVGGYTGIITPNMVIGVN